MPPSTCTPLPPPSSPGTEFVPPARRAGLLVRPQGGGAYVVKEPVGGKFFTLGTEEHTLLFLLDGQRRAEEICRAFETQTGAPLSADDVQEFVKLAHARGLLEPEAASGGSAETADGAARPSAHDQRSAEAKRRLQGNIFYLRFRLMDPEKLFHWLEPRIRFVWTRGFVGISILAMLAALMVVLANGRDLVSRFPRSLDGTTILAVWLAVVLVTTLHECAHGLTCKHFGGEVREMGFLLMFFTPCFFCNVSDAWLFREKYQRIWVGLAGLYCDFCLWALCVFAWRITPQQSLVNYLAWVGLSVCGARTFFNINPLLKLDGYYVLSDLTEIHNLRRRGQEQWLATLRWLLWGAPRPPAVPRRRFLLTHGAASWLFTVGLLLTMCMALLHLRGSHWGWAGIALSLTIFFLMLRTMFRGLTQGEVRNMIAKRPRRTLMWAAGLAVVPVALFLGRVNERVGGSFQVRPRTHMEIRAPEAGFFRDVCAEEGSPLTTGAVVGRLEVPDLASNIAEKRAEVRECQANLRRLESGARPEEVKEQGLRVGRATHWRDLAQIDLTRAKQTLREELIRLDQLIAQSNAELEYCEQACAASEKLYSQQAMSESQYQAMKKRRQIALSQCEQARAQKRAREASGALEAEAELARREKELADVKASLSLLQAGTRPEDIDAERARLARLQEELKYLLGVQERVVLRSPGGGVVITPRMHEKNGQYFEKGAIICVVEDALCPEAEIVLSEEDQAAVQPGQRVEMKARSLPFRTFVGRIVRKAPTAVAGENHGATTVTAYCRLDAVDAALLSGMTGYARVYREKQPLGSILATRVLQYVRTEFWW